MDLNQTRRFASSSSSSLMQVHNFMEVPPSILPTEQPSQHEVQNFMLMPHHNMQLHDHPASHHGVHNFMQMPHHQTMLPRRPPQQYEVEGDAMREHRLQLWKQNLRLFWQERLLDIDQISEVKQHLLPLARIKRIMKADEDVKMISADAPVLFAKACEIFILELTFRAWSKIEENNRRTMQRSDIANAINQGEVLDFLHRIIRKDDTKIEEPASRGKGVAELVPRNGGVNFPIMDVNHYLQNLNAEFMARQQEIPPHYMVQPPMPPTWYFYGSQGPQASENSES